MDNSICEIGVGFYLFSNFPWFLNSPLNEVLTLSLCVSQVQKLQGILKPMMLRRLKEDVEKNLAPKEETIIEVRLRSHHRCLGCRRLCRNSFTSSDNVVHSAVKH